MRPSSMRTAPMRTGPLVTGRTGTRLTVTRLIRAGLTLVVCAALLGSPLPGIGGHHEAATAAVQEVAGASQVGLVSSQVLGVRALPSAGTDDRQRTAVWGWPLAGTPEIARPFDPPARRWDSGHRGIDLVGVSGEPVLAVDDGVVTFSGVIAGVGVVSITHASGLRSTYQPVEDRASRGDRVTRGDRVGRLAGGGHCRGAVVDCLHLGAVRGKDAYVDPTPLLTGVELSLLPVAP